MGSVSVSDHTAFEAPDPGYWVPNGYAVLLVDLPGLGASQSNPAPGIGHQERWADVMSWLEAQDWCSGKVGMSGVSALCATQWVAAMGDAPPQLKAIIPWEGFNEQGPGGGYGGIPETAFPEWIVGVWVGPNINHDAPGPEPFLFDWKHDPSAIRVPALVCASFSDQELHSWDTFEAFRLLDTGDKWLYTHRRQKWGASTARTSWRCRNGSWTSSSRTPTTRSATCPGSAWKSTRAGSPTPSRACPSGRQPRREYRELYLDAQAGVAFPAAPSSGLLGDHRARPDQRPGQPRRLRPRLRQDTDIVGNSALRLFIETEDGTDADLFVGVEKLDTDGNEVYFFSASGGNANGPVTRGWLRASKRALNTERSTDARPVLSSRSTSRSPPARSSRSTSP